MITRITYLSHQMVNKNTPLKILPFFLCFLFPFYSKGYQDSYHSFICDFYFLGLVALKVLSHVVQTHQHREQEKEKKDEENLNQNEIVQNNFWIMVQRKKKVHS